MRTAVRTMMENAERKAANSSRPDALEVAGIAAEVERMVEMKEKPVEFDGPDGLLFRFRQSR